MERNKSLETELRNKDEQRNKYAHHITKLENKCRDSNIEVDRMKKDNQKLTAHVKKLEEESLENLNLHDEAIKVMEEDIQKLEGELERRTYEYEHKVRNYEDVIAMYAKEMKKPVHMFVTGKSPFRDSRWRNDATPSQSTYHQDVNLQRATDQRMFEAIPVTKTCTKADDTKRRKQSMTRRMVVTGNEQNGNIDIIPNRNTVNVPNGNTDNVPNGNTDNVPTDNEQTGNNSTVSNDNTGNEPNVNTSNNRNGNKPDQDRGGKFRKSKMTPHMTSIHPDTARGKPAGKGTPLEGLQIVNTPSTKPCMPVTSGVNLSPRTKQPVRNMNLSKKY